MSHAVSMALRNPRGQPVPVGQNGCVCEGGRDTGRDRGKDGGTKGRREGEKRNNVCIVKTSHLPTLTHNV